MKTFTARSESVLETYLRDLREFGSGLKKESEIFREAASWAVKDLPASLEAAHGAIDGVLKSTAEIISQGKDTLLSPSDVEADAPEASRSLNLRRYSWFDAQLRAIQNDVNTYSEEPEDTDDYNNWKLGFEMAEKSEQVKNLIGENGVMEEIYNRVVPNTVDSDTFWCRYFYRVHKLKQQEDVRANLVKRAISIDDEEELTWDVHEDEDDDKKENKHQPQSKVVDAEENKEMDNEESPQIVNSKESSASNQEEHRGAAVVDEKGENKNNKKSDLKDVPNKVKVKADHFVPSEESDVKDVSNKEEELGWDEIEDVGTDDDEKVSHSRSSNSNRANVGKRLSAAEEDEDLTWGVEEDDDEHAKS